jgi:hypothetical protein
MPLRGRSAFFFLFLSFLCFQHYTHLAAHEQPVRADHVRVHEGDGGDGEEVAHRAGQAEDLVEELEVGAGGQHLFLCLRVVTCRKDRKKKESEKKREKKRRCWAGSVTDILIALLFLHFFFFLSFFSLSVS